MEQPIIVLVADEAAVLEALEPDVARRFGNDCEILAFRDPEEALTRLAEFAAERAPVALLMVDEDLSTISGIEFTVRAHALHPAAKRILLVERNYTAANPVVTAMTLGQIDYHLVDRGTPTAASTRRSASSSPGGRERAPRASPCSASWRRSTGICRTRYGTSSRAWGCRSCRSPPAQRTGPPCCARPGRRGRSGRS